MNKLIAIILLISLTSCFTERIELDYNQNENKKIVITGWITNLDEPQFITVQNTVNYLGNVLPDPVTDADVTISDDRGSYVLSHLEEGKYFLPQNWVARVGDNYKLNVSHDGSIYTSEHIMRPCPEIENLFFTEVEDIEETDSIHIYETIFSFQEIPGEGDAYYGIDYVAGSTDRDSLFNGQFTNDEFVDGEYFEDIDISDQDRLFKEGDQVVLDIFSIGFETSEYLVDVQSEVFRGGIFDAPPANVRTNITGGAAGYFIVSAANREIFTIQ